MYLFSHEHPHERFPKEKWVIQLGYIHVQWLAIYFLKGTYMFSVIMIFFIEHTALEAVVHGFPYTFHDYNKFVQHISSAIWPDSCLSALLICKVCHKQQGALAVKCELAGACCVIQLIFYVCALKKVLNKLFGLTCTEIEFSSKYNIQQNRTKESLNVIISGTIMQVSLCQQLVRWIF